MPSVRRYEVSARGPTPSRRLRRARAPSTGAFHEAVNVAVLVEVPVIFVIENNRFASCTDKRGEVGAARRGGGARVRDCPRRTIDATK